MAKERAFLLLEGIGKEYYVDGNPFTALDGISLAFPKTGFVSILGPSGCGKTTLLNIIGGLDRATRGRLLIDGKDTSSFKDRDWDAYRNKRLGFVFQSYNLIPHETVIDNVETVPLLAGIKPRERETMAKEALFKVGLAGLEKKKPNQLSGGQAQRVAIARALASSPDIILADEPTGALDSKSSEEVISLLKEASKDRLVILVSHNRSLAERYSDRLVEMGDGKIVSDTKPLVALEPSLGTGGEGKTAMGFFAAIKSSAKNVMSKKGRAILTSLASSVGIAGVGLVLALATGFTSYVSDVETSMAASVPITINKRTVVYSSTTAGNENGDEYPNDDNLYVLETTGQSYVSKTNDISNEYIDYVQALIDDPELAKRNLASDVLIQKEGASFNIITSSTIDENDPEATFYLLNQDQGASSNSMTSMVTSLASLPSSVFHPLYGLGTEEDPSSQYDLIYGRYPTSMNDLVLIVDRYNQISSSTLQALGIVPSSGYGGTAIHFSELLEKKTYKAYLPQDFYRKTDGYSYKTTAYDGLSISFDPIDRTLKATADGKREIELKPYVAPGNDSDSYREFYFDESNNPIELKIVGVVRPSAESVISTMPCSIGYLPSLSEYFRNDTSEEAQAMAEMQRDGWYLPEFTAGSSEERKDALLSLNEALANLDLSSINASTMTSFIDSLSGVICYRSFFTYETYLEIDQPPDWLTTYGYLLYSRRIGATFNEEDARSILEPLVNGGSVPLADLIKIVMDDGFFSSDSDGLNFADFVAYAEGYSLVTSILVFPASMTTKPELRSYLDAYNEGKEPSHQVDYIDAMADFTDGLGQMVTMISVVLVVLASVSLLVSSIMMAVITYVSVLERTKEIGILRACGARKKDVGRLFEAECVIIGGVAGLIGILAAYILTIPLNAIVSSVFASVISLPNLASLSPLLALALVAASILLSFVAGLIPARLAAKKDPVVALRSE